MSPVTVMFLTFLAVVMAVAGAYSLLSDLYLRDRTRVKQRLDDEFRSRLRKRAEKSNLFKNLDQLAADASIDQTDTSWPARFRAMVEQSGLDITPARLLTTMLLIGGGVGLLAGVLRQSVLI